MNVLHQIAEKISSAKDFTEDMSLVNGQAGMALFLFHYARVVESEPYYEVAQNLLVENYRYLVRQIKHPHLSAVPGIGWLISHLGQQQLIGINTDEMLEKVDKVIFDKLQFGFSRLFDQGGLLDMTNYLLQRYAETGSDITRMMIAERLLLVIDEIRMKMDEGIFKVFDRHYAPVESRMMLNKMRGLSAVLHFISRVKELGIYPVIIGEMEAEIIAWLTEYRTLVHTDFTTLLRVRDAMGRAGVEMVLEELPAVKNIVRWEDLVLSCKLLGAGAEDIRQMLQTGVCQELERGRGMPDLGLSGGLAGIGMVLLEGVSGSFVDWEEGLLS
ncbi:hypothetical protein [Chitinophaga sp. LS1]|uniref:hypothetical protein n=1 Tax=Chitinophaga sp. LS1 TaxID=3051176 RepID=UPI002AABA38D|nr:hypothetical protein [Chitinophaga sp. LS1]WPV65514.1 hypothetical protein QQL36_27305 [Chitinophaga sp. LS1]